MPSDGGTLSGIRQHQNGSRCDGRCGNAPASGNISPAQLSAALAKQVGREGKALGRGDLNDLARIGQLFVRDQVPNSGTAQRMAYQGLLTGGVGAPAAGLGLMMTGSPSGSALYGLSATAASLLTPRLVQALANSAPVQRVYGPSGGESCRQFLGGRLAQSRASHRTTSADASCQWGAAIAV